LIRREAVQGFVHPKPVWMIRPLGSLLHRRSRSNNRPWLLRSVNQRRERQPPRVGD
jgi:hypothetical protein